MKNMKNSIKNVVFILISVIFIVSCGGCEGRKKVKFIPESTGSPYEMVVVCDNNLWDGEIGAAVSELFLASDPMMNEAEPYFNIIRKREYGFKGIFIKHRNILMMKVDSTMSNDKNTQYFVKDNLWAMPQIVISLKAKTAELLYDLFLLKEKEIMSLFETAEQIRFEDKLKKYASKNIDTLVKNNLNIGISLPKNYELRSLIKPDFIWLSYEMPLSSQGVVIYTYPYTGQKLNLKNLIKMRNKYVSRIPGQLEDSYMESSDAFKPTLEDVHINDNNWVKMSGFWRVHNDFMGGPYRNYTTIDKKNNRVVSVDCYVYSPDRNKGQRNYIKQLDAVVRTIEL